MARLGLPLHCLQCLYGYIHRRYIKVKALSVQLSICLRELQVLQQCTHSDLEANRVFSFHGRRSHFGATPT